MSEKDYYEILGIRPNASQDEIDLAYKGRRSQYHPDRYGRADEETLAWATARMKEVNEAHAVLNNPVERARYDRQRGSGSAKPQASASKETRPKPTRTLLQFLQEYVPDTELFQKIHVAPNIPRKKLYGAIDSYGGGLKPADIVALVDNTVFGGAKEGVLITEREIRFKEIFQPGGAIALEAVEKIEAVKNRVRVNGRNIIELNVTDESEAREFFDLLNDYCMQCAEDAADDEDDEDEEYAEDEDESSQLGNGYFGYLDDVIDEQVDDAPNKRERKSWQLARAMLLLSELLETWGSEMAGVSPEQGEILSSDAIRFEVITYSLVVVERVLVEVMDAPEHVAAEIVADLSKRLQVGCFINGDEDDFSDLLDALDEEEDEIMEAVQALDAWAEYLRRSKSYRLLFAQKDPQELCREFGRSIRWPTLLHVHSPDSAGELLGLTRQAVDAALDEDDITEFLKRLNGVIKKIVIEWAKEFA